MGIDTGLNTNAARMRLAVCKPLSTDSFQLPGQTVERETGIEPASLAWKARVLPLNYSRTEPGDSLRFLVEGAGFEPAYA
jgi:hypothetical protein